MMKSPADLRTASAALAILLSPALEAAPVRVVDFGHSWGVGFYRDTTPAVMPGVDVDGDGASSADRVRAWPFRLDIPLNPSAVTYDSSLPSARFYGGLYVGIPAPSGTSTTAVLSEGHINQNHEMRDDWNLMTLPTTSLRPDLESYEAAGLWLWRKEDFLNGASDPSRLVSFSSPEDYIAVFVSRYFAGVNWGRWVIQNGSTFYISEPTFAGRTEPITELSPSGTTTGVVRTAHTVRPTQVRWAEYDPTGGGTNLSNPRGLRFEWLATPDYRNRTFDDVRAAGFLVQRDLAPGVPASTALSLKEPIALKWNAFQVGATVTPPLAASPNVDLVPVGGSPAAPAFWAMRTEVRYLDWIRVFSWAENNQRARNFSDGVAREVPSYGFERDGAIGSSEAVLAASHSPLEPVASIGWQDALAWCNALSELEGLEPAYYEDAAFTKVFRQVLDRNVRASRDLRKTVHWKTTSPGYRLPTEAEWRTLAGDATLDGTQAWTSANAGGRTRIGGSLAANSHGLHDMAGNVSEYVWDLAGSVFDPAVHTTRTVLGASFRHPADENSTSLIPFGERPWSGSPSIGFRPVRTGPASLAPAVSPLPARSFNANLDVPPAPEVALTDAQARELVGSWTPLAEAPGAGTLAPGSTPLALVTMGAYDLEVGRTEVPYRAWLRVRQWAERRLGYRFNYAGDMGSARHNPALERSPDEPVTNISWYDAPVWCNALSELLQLDPVYLSASGQVERQASPFRIRTYDYYGYPNTGNVLGRPVDDTVIVELLPNPTRNGFRLPTQTEAQTYGATQYSHTSSANFTTQALGWFSDDPVFAGGASTVKAMPVGSKAADPARNGLHDILGNVREWCYNASSLFGAYIIGNDVGHARNVYPHTMNRNEDEGEGRALVGLRVVKLKGTGTEPPAITAGPASATLLEGAPLNLSVTTAGSPPLSFRWFLNGQLLPSETSSTLQRTAATEVDAGHYRVEVSSPYGTALSAIASVSVLPRLPSAGPDLSVLPSPLVIRGVPGAVVSAPIGIFNGGSLPLDWSVQLPAAGSGYTHSRSASGGPAFSWRDITASGGTVLSALSGKDDAVATLAPGSGFSFPFHGSTFTSVIVSTNGYIHFGGTRPVGDWSNTTLPSAGAPEYLVAVLWDDHVVDASSNVYWKLDTDGLVITWSNVRTYTGSYRQTFQVLLMTDGSIRTQYQSLGPVAAATVGLQRNAGTGLLVSLNSANPPSAGEAISFVPSLPWLAGVSPSSGTTVPGGQSAPLLTASTVGLAAGDLRETTITVASNDPDSPSLPHTVRLEVTASAPPLEILATPLEAVLAGSPVSLQLLSAGSSGPVVWSTTGGALPAGLELSTAGVISGTPVTPGVHTFSVAVTDGPDRTAGASLSLRVLTPLPPLPNSGALPDGLGGSAYSASLTATHGLSPLGWAATSPLPAGLSLATSGTVTGVPMVAGGFSIGVRVTDALGRSMDGIVSLSIAAPSPPSAAGNTLPVAVLNQPYLRHLQATGGFGGYTWSLIGPEPRGMTLNANGVLSGTPLEIGSAELRVRVTDAGGLVGETTLLLVVAATNPARPEVVAGGWNLHNVTYWNNANMFADLMRSASAWQHNWSDYPFETDANGYPVNIPSGIIPGAKITLWESGDHVLTWRGAGLVRLEGMTLVSEDLSAIPRRRVYRKTAGVDTPQLVRVQILDSIPATEIRVWGPELEPGAGRTAAVFHPAFLDRLKDNSAILRFMDWNLTNSSALHGTWSARRLPTRYTEADVTSYETMIALCNEADKDMWICIPHSVEDADPGYVSALARLIATGMDGDVRVCEPLEPGLKVYVEWSNEVWNSQFPQFAWAVEKAKQRLGVTTLADYNEVWRIIGEYHARAFRTFRETFAAAGRDVDAVVGVLATQIGGALVGLHMQGVETVASADPARAALCRPDAIAVGAYFGHDLDDWVVANVPAPGELQPAALDSAFAELESMVRGEFRDAVVSSRANAASAGLPLIAYEGGQHVVGTGANASNSALTAFLTAMNRDVRMGSLVRLSLDLWSLERGGIFMAFNETGPYGSFGSWGFREFWHQSLAQAPKAAAFNDWLRRMQQSHILALELPSGNLGYSYALPIDARIRSAPASWSILAGALPAGISLGADGVLSGIPVDHGIFSFTVGLADAAGKTDARAFTFAVGTDRLNETLPPAADTFVYGLSSAQGTNYGTSSAFSTHTSNLRYALLRWDLTRLAGRRISRATLTLNRTGTTTATTGTLWTHSPESAWGETAVTWSSGRPALSASFASFPVSTSTTAHSVDVTAWAAARAGSPTAGLAVTTDQYCAWHAKESISGTGPILVVEVDPDQLVTTYWDQWRRLHFGEAVADPDADPDGDGMSNILEYALATDPHAGGPSPARIVGDGGTVSLRVPYNSLQRDRRLRVLGSTDLVSWPIVLFDSALTPGEGSVWTELELALAPHFPSAQRMFVRVEGSLLSP